jgi:hypothetical protein
LEQFEQRLRRLSVKPIPGEWRTEILAATRDAQAIRRASRSTHRSLLSTINHQLSTILWPHPKAWVGLAAVWIFIFILNFSMRDKAPVMAEKFTPPSPDAIVELKKQQRMFVKLVGANELPDANRQNTFPPKPRSARTEMLMT